MEQPSVFKIKNIRLLNQRTCELYMEHVETSSIKGWIINCNETFFHQFHEQLNALCQSAHPFQMLLQLKQFHKVEVLC